MPRSRRARRNHEFRVESVAGQRQRFVYVIARPLKFARQLNLTSLFEGKFLLCHWGVLVSEYCRHRLKLEIQTFQSGVRTNIGSLGTVFELFRTTENKSIAHEITNFGSNELNGDWRFITFTYIGNSQFSDIVLARQGINICKAIGLTNLACRITELYPDYHGYSNNCQNFVQYLLDKVCPKCSTPQTIQELINNFSTSFPHTSSLTTSLDGIFQRIMALFRPSKTYQRIWFPEFDEALSLACALDKIACEENVHYAFVGSFAAMLKDGNLQISQLEIILAPGYPVNKLKKLWENMSSILELASSIRLVINIQNTPELDISMGFESGTRGLFLNVLPSIIDCCLCDAENSNS